MAGDEIQMRVLYKRNQYCTTSVVNSDARASGIPLLLSSIELDPSPTVAVRFVSQLIFGDRLAVSGVREVDEKRGEQPQISASCTK